MFPLRAIINLCVRLRIHPNTLTLIGVIVNVAAAWALGFGRFMLAFVIMLVANIFDFIDGKVAHLAAAAVGVRRVLGLDARPLLGSRAADRPDLPVLEAGPQRLRDGRGAGADLLDHDKLCAGPRRVAGREMQSGVHGAPRAHRALHDRRGHQPDGRRAVGDSGAVDPGGRQPDLLHLSGAQQAADAVARRLAGIFNRALFWTDERATIPYDAWVLAILSFVWLTPPDWLGDPTASGPGLIGLLTSSR